MSRIPGGDGRDEDERTVVDRDALDSSRPGPPGAGGSLMGEGGDEEPDATMMIQVPGGGPSPGPAAAGVPSEAHLVAIAGNDTGQVYPLRQGTVLVGRGLQCSIVLNDPSVSRRHFNILRTPSAWKLIDLGSGNGTRVDGQLVQETELAEGSRIETGITALEFHLGPATARAPSPSPQAAPQPAPPAPVVPRQPAPVRPERMEPAPREDHPPMQVVSPEQEAVAIEEEPEEAAGGGVLKLIVIVLAALVVGLGGFIAVDKIAGLGIVFGDDAEQAEQAGGAAAVDDLVAEAGALREERDWGGALEKLEEAEAAAKEAGVDTVAIRKSIREVRAERTALADWEAALEAIAAGRVDDARKSLLLVPDDSVYYAEAQEKLATLQAGAGAAPGAGGREKPVDPRFAAAVKSFDAQDFAAAAAAFREAATKIDDSAGSSAAIARATAVEDFAAAWKAAGAAASRARHDEAIAKYEEALERNETVGGGLGDAVEAKLAAELVARGQAHLRKDRFREAATDIRRAMKLAPDSPDIGAAKESLRGAVNDIREEAFELLNNKRGAEALPLFELVKWVVGEDDPRWSEADGFIMGIREQQRAGGGAE